MNWLHVGRYRVTYFPLRTHDWIKIGEVLDIWEAPVPVPHFPMRVTGPDGKYVPLYRKDFDEWFEPEHKPFNDKLDELLK